MSDPVSPQDRLAGLSREQRAALFEQIRRRKEKERAAAPPDRIPRRPPGLDPVPLSFAQERLWFIDRLQPGLTAYNIPQALLIAGAVSPAVFAAVLGEVVRRHEALRTTFREADGRPVQVIAPAGGWALPLVDLSALPAGIRDAQARRLAQEEAERPFDLERGPLLRAALLRLAPAKHALLLDMHHIVSDGWSMGVLVREITALHAAFAAGAPSPLPELPVQYADFAVWQRGWLRGEVLARQTAYWRQALAGAPVSLELPADRPLPAERTHVGGRLYAPFDPVFKRDLALLARQHDATPFMVLLAGFQALLARMTGTEDLAVGSPIANRNRQEIEPLIGFFVNTLVLRGDLTGDPTFRELLARSRKATLEAYAHQDLPFEQLVEELKPERRLAVNPLFQILFAVQNAPVGAMDLPGLSLAPLEFDTQVAKFDLELSFWEFAEGLTADLVYSTERFDPATALRLAAHLETLLRALMADPGRPVSEAALLSAAERQQLVREWNDTGRSFAAALLVHEIVERQAELEPEGAAVEHADGALTYRELVTRARRIAGVLRAAGVGPDAPVGLWTGRSLALPLSVLAVLEAGGACLPLDPTYPADRLALMIADAAPRVVLAEETALAGVPAGLLTGLEVIVLDRWGEIAAGSAPPAFPDVAAVRPDAGNLVYILYTSGSTGRPKGVALTHRALANLIAWAGEARPDRGRRVLQFSPLGFDVSFEELFSTWASGGTLVLMPDELRRDPAALLAFLIEERIERVFQPFVALQQLAEAAREQGRTPPDLRELITAGEQLRVTPAVAALCGRGARLFNEYGPTETHVTTAFLLAGEPGGWPALPPIGRPVANHRILLLDRGRLPVPLGNPGELCIGGAGLARGYFRRPALTADRFIPDPSGIEPGARLYRTGDLARWTTGGDLEYLGRTDFQVKVRGYRVEPGEVEAAVAACGQVRDAAVVARQDPPGGLRLVAYVVWDGEGGSEAELRDALKERLPAAMVPAAVVGLAALPLTPSGKVDRRALAGPAFAPPGAEAAAGYVEPATNTQRELAAIWSEILGVERVGAADDFFDLGGHSLLAVQVLSRMRGRLGVELPVRALFEAPTLAGLARRAEQAGALTERGPRPRLAGEPAPLSFGQGRLWFLDRMEPGNTAFNMGSSLRLRGRLDPRVLERAVNEIVRRHEALRATFVEVDGQPLQRTLPSLRIPLPAVDLSALAEAPSEAEAARVARASLAAPFDLGAGPLVRTSLLRLAPDLHLFLLDVHHIVSDGWSAGVMNRELTALYAAFLAGRPSPLPPLPIQFGDFARWQREWLTGETLEAQLAYWRGKLGGNLAPLDLPTDRPRPALQTFRGGSLDLDVPEATAGALRRLSREQGASLFMTLLAAFQALLARLAGQEDVVVGTPIAGRRHPETEGLIGFFLNTLSLRTDLSGNPTFRELLVRVRETTLGSYEHQDIPFEALLAELKPERDLSRTPLFQVFFNMLNLPPEGERLPDLEIEWGPAPAPESKFDLTFYVGEATGAIQVHLVYNADLFDEPRMAELLRQYRLVLERAARQPDGRIRSFSLVTPEAAAVLPDPARPLGSQWHGAVHELFLAAARRHPERTAVVDPQGSWTYGELAVAVGRLAAHLRTAGLEPGDRVAIWAHRSAPVAWAVLGALAAGGAFVMLDPAYPAARLVEILRLASPRAWVALADAGAPPPEVEELLAGWQAEGSLLGRRVLPGGGPAAAGGLLAALPEAMEPVATGPDDLAFVAFTSGSTGTPKGILGRHGPLSHFLPWQRERFGLSEADRYSLLSGLAHDPLQRDLFTALATGATLCVPDPEEIFIPGRLAAWAARQGITVAHLTPAMGQVLTEPPGDGTGPAPIPSLRYVLLVGDVLTRLDVDRLRRLAPGVTCVNLYGSTETQRAVGYHVVEPDAGLAGQRALQVLPLGRGMEDVQILVVNTAINASEQLAGIGEVGEIWMRSPHLARGYLGDEALTRERFRANPFSGPFPGGEADRVYRTGDLGRYLPDGEVAFAGRADQQVKIRGFRIEPGEIQAAIGRLEGVRESVVVVREERGDRYLVAYVVPESGAAPDLTGRLRPFLAARLPDYMVPAAFVELAVLPLTPNGKVDRRALPAPQRQAARIAAPRGPVEERLAGVWADLLRLDRVGAHDNFFDLGGHSLLATQLVSRVRGAFEVELPLRAIFEAPTVAGLAAWIERALGTSGRPPAAPPIVRAPRDRPLALSFAQERLWFLQLLEPASPVYNMMAAVRLAGRLAAGALAAALSEILRRHEALRTTFRATATGAVQEVHPWSPLPQPTIDLSALPESARPGEARRIAEAEAARPFDLERGPLLRALLLRIAGEDHVALWSTHHVTADGWSLSAVFVPELTRLYAAFVQGLPSPLPELPVQYADYAAWQREWLRGEVLAEQLGYWRRQLAGLAPLELPADRPRPPAPSGRGGSLSWELPAGRKESLSRLARAGDATLFMALFAAFAAVLHRRTGAVEVPVGMPVANRSRREIEGLIGFFVNTLVLRGDLAGDPDLQALLARSRGAVLGALSHQDIPFERLVDELALPRNPHRPPLLRVSFQLQTAPADGYLELPGLTLIPFETRVEAAKFDLVVNLYEAGEGIFGIFQYDSDLFDAATIARLAGHFTTLLAAWIDEPGKRLSDLPLLTAAERHQLLAEWNPGLPLTDGGRRCLHHLFEAQVDRAPEALALSGLTYGELDRRANRLARHLLAAGARPGDRVALLLERSAEMVVAILAVLKAGGAYVPLDPAYPAERLAFTLEDSGASLLITEGDLTAGAVRAVRLDAERERIERRSGERLGRLEMPLDPELPAYVIYTSGSTGRPKGVVVSHAGAGRLFTSTAPWFGFGAEDVWTLFHSYAFDFSVWELWGALLHGGRLVVVPYWQSRSPEGFYRLLRDERVTVLNQTPSAFRQLLWAEEAMLHGEAPDLALRWVIFGGEALEPASLAPWFARHGDERPRLANMYGITETTVHVTYRPVRSADLAAGSLIGEPIPDLAVHLLDASLQLVPAGTPGEIHVGGAGLAQGYLGRPDLTAGRFVPDPFSERPGARLYRSGDLARRLPDGDLEYLGRIDQQVKIRGFRIELGEIEAALAAEAGVREAVVLARDGRLVAYLSGEAADPAVLRRSLAERLPEYMLPSAFVFLDALPLTENGKVDRRALPAPEAARAASARSRVAPRDPLERFLAGQFHEVLGLPADREVGADEDFFELGGTSITSAIFIHRLQEALGEIVHIVAIFDNPAVSTLADYLRERHAGAARRLNTGSEAATVAPERGVLVPLQAGSPGRRPLFCVHSVGGEVVSYRELARHLGPGQPVYGLQSPDPPLRGVREMAARYVAAIQEVQPAGPYRIAGWSMGGIVAFEIARQLEAAGEKTDILAVIDAASPDRWAGEPERSDTEMVTLFATALEQLHGGDLDLPPGFELPVIDPAGLDVDAALAIALDLGRQVGLLSPNLELAELRRLFERFQANRRSLSSYREPYAYGGEAHLFRAADHLAVKGNEDPTLGWGELLNGRVRILDAPGDHRTIMKRGAAIMAAHLRELFEEGD